MTGDTVIARGYRNRPLVRKVHSSGDRVVYLVTNEQFNLITDGKSSVPPIGFPKEDVFEYDETVVTSGSVDWSKLKNWSVEEGAAT